MAGKQARQLAAGNTEGCELLRQRLGMALLQALERADHVLAAGQLGAAGIGAKFTITREPRNDHTGQNSEQNLQDHYNEKIEGPGTAAFVAVAAHGAIDNAAD